jgi:hypothetical protein
MFAVRRTLRRAHHTPARASRTDVASHHNEHLLALSLASPIDG